MSAANVLAARLDAISRQVRVQADDITAVRTVAEHANRVLGDLTDRVSSVGQLATAAAQAVAESGKDEREGQVVKLWSWLAAPRIPALAGLVEWVDLVLMQYPDTKDVLSECWPYHPWIVEELLALQTAWNEAYRGKQPSGVKAVDWHDRHRPGVMARIGKTLMDCGLDAHEPGRRADHRNVPTVSETGWAEDAGTWWTSVRPSAVDGSTECHAGSQGR